MFDTYECIHCRFLNNKKTPTRDVAIELATPLILREPVNVQRYEICFDPQQNPTVVSIN